MAFAPSNTVAAVLSSPKVISINYSVLNGLASRLVHNGA